MEPSYSSEFDTDLLKDVVVSRDFKLANSELVKRMKACIEEYRRKFPGRDVLITCTYRSPGEQKRLFNQGRFGDKRPVCTNCDGTFKKSDHNQFPAKAVDIAILDGGKTLYDEVAIYPLGVIARDAGLDWGGFWEKCVHCHKVLAEHTATDHDYACFKDYPHFGWKGE